MDISQYVNKVSTTKDNSEVIQHLDSFFDEMKPGDIVTTTQLCEYLTAQGIELPEKQRTDVPLLSAPRTAALITGNVVKEKRGEGKFGRIVYKKL